MIILLAEDDMDDQELLAEAFSQIDPSIKLISFNTGKKFLQYLEELPEKEIPDMVLLDYNLPEINGAEILSHLRQDKRYKPIVKLVWSTSDSALYETSCLALGASAYLVKPTRIAGLIELAKQMIGYLN